MKIKISNDDGGEAILSGAVYLNNQLLLGIYCNRYLKQVGSIDGTLAFKNKSLTISGYDDAGCNFHHKIISCDEGYISKRFRTGLAGSKSGQAHDFISVSMSVSKKIGNNTCITVEEQFYNDARMILLAKSDIPIKEEWMPYIIKRLQERDFCNVLEANHIQSKDGVIPNRYMSSRVKSGVICNAGLQIPLKTPQGKYRIVNFEELKVFQVAKYMTGTDLENIVSEGLRSKEISLDCKNPEFRPIGINNFDNYIAHFREDLVAALDRKVIPVRPTKSKLEATALKKSRLFRGQRGCVNATAGAMDDGRKFELMCEEMGCGKTKQALAAVEEHFNRVWLRKHRGKTLKDCLMSGEVEYRTIVTGPGHITEKWAEEAKSEIPDIKTYIIHDVSDFEEIRRKGKERNGKEMYVISKDALKLGSTVSPIPNKYVTKMRPKRMACARCLNNNIVNYKPIGATGAACPDCGGRFWKGVTFPGNYSLTTDGMICPHCGELLLKATKEIKEGKVDNETLIESVLRPEDFKSKTVANSVCIHCGAQLWGVNAKVCGGEQPVSSWIKVKHFKNEQRKSEDVDFVFAPFRNGVRDTSFLDEFVKKVPGNIYTICKEEPGVRKAAPSEFIKKYLKGYFDVCILDECHKFENGNSAQTIAACALSSVSDFTIGLTGTVSNGTASAFWPLLWMWMPRTMRAKGYTYDSGSLMDFVKKYGSIKSTYKKDDSELDSGYNKSSRSGKRLGAPKVAPGISPLLFVDFLLENCVFLDMSDMAEALPDLNEEVVPVELPTKVEQAYKTTIREIRDAIVGDNEGNKLTATLLTQSLIYPDMPMNTKPIMSAIRPNTIIVEPLDFGEEYKDKLLPKEQEIVNIIKKEQKENRRVFVFASFTGEYTPLPRWKEIIEENCGLRGKVAILEARTCSADKRSAWIAKKAKEDMQVILCNCKLVETGLDFCFTHEGVFYNYPTIIFGQITFELAVLWQASHRHYRLNQPLECRTYWCAYERTAQMDALECMALKISSVAAIQGKFSSGALAAMASGVDPRVKLAEALKAGTMADGTEVVELFNKVSGGVEKPTVEDTDVMATYFEVLGAEAVAQKEADSMFDFDFFNDVIGTDENPVEITAKETKTAAKATPVVASAEEEVMLIDLEGLTKVSKKGETVIDCSDFLDFEELLNNDVTAESKLTLTADTKVKRSRKKYCEGQLNMLDFFAS